MRRDYDYLFKLVLIGDSGVGKSCLLLRFVDDNFSEFYVSTIGVDFRFRTLTVDNKLVKLQIWDTAGQEKFRTITSAYYRGADGIIVVYDISQHKSFEHVDDWLREAARYAKEGVVKLVVGNKSDLPNRDVTPEEGAALAERHRMQHIETSSLNSNNVDRAFRMIAQRLMELKSGQDVNSTSSGIRVPRGLPVEAQPPNSNAGTCCGN
eukprot:c33009_g1_i1.p1 GENE.c33009_g1_i1~~c33009_g1_i1.p1  ORF type:complete len:208 (+),score=43.90 c33009_g1_i1:48-671(+)